MTDFAQETAQLEAQAFELEQKTAIAHEAKTVLDSWVRYEGQVKQRQQRELAGIAPTQALDEAGMGREGRRPRGRKGGRIGALGKAGSHNSWHSDPQ